MKKLLILLITFAALVAFVGFSAAQVTYPLEVDVVSPSPTATITVTPAPGFANTPCPPSNALACTTQYPAGTPVTVTATSGVPVLGHNWQFANYVSGPPLGTNIGPPTIVSGCVWTTNTCSFVMPANRLEVHVEIIGAPPPPTSCQDDMSGVLTISPPTVSSVTATSAVLTGTVSVNPIPSGCTYTARLVWGPLPVPPFPNVLATGSIPPSLFLTGLRGSEWVNFDGRVS